MDDYKLLLRQIKVISTGSYMRFTKARDFADIVTTLCSIARAFQRGELENSRNLEEFNIQKEVENIA